jgi:hypothetical protein
MYLWVSPVSVPATSHIRFEIRIVIVIVIVIRIRIIRIIRICFTWRNRGEVLLRISMDDSVATFLSQRRCLDDVTRSRRRKQWTGHLDYFGKIQFGGTIIMSSSEMFPIYCQQEKDDEKTRRVHIKACRRSWN